MIEEKILEILKLQKNKMAESLEIQEEFIFHLYPDNTIGDFYKFNVNDYSKDAIQMMITYFNIAQLEHIIEYIEHEIIQKQTA